MALFNHLFPYSNLHDINLDWIISIIKSIDPAVIQALQELTPDIIKQVNQKVNEAQAAAIAAQSSASEANTARENAATSASGASQDATKAAADAVRAENAKTAVENSLVPSSIAVTSENSNLYYYAVSKSGRSVSIYVWGSIKSLPETEQIAIAKIDSSFREGTHILCLKSVDGVVNSQFYAKIETDGRITIDKSRIAIGNEFSVTGIAYTPT